MCLWNIYFQIAQRSLNWAQRTELNMGACAFNPDNDVQSTGYCTGKLEDGAVCAEERSLELNDNCALFENDNLGKTMQCFGYSNSYTLGYSYSVLIMNLRLWCT